MNNFKIRSYEKEILDRNNIPFEDIALNMRELNFINTYLGGHTISINGFKQFLFPAKSYTICEVGCGGGDNMNAIQLFADKNNIKLSWIGIDLNPYCIDFAKQQQQQLDAAWIVDNYKNVTFENKPDVIFCSLFTHHLNREELQEFLLWCRSNARVGFYINDLHRHRFAYWTIKILTHFFSKSYLVKNDAPLSVKRGFIKEEWENIFTDLNINNYKIKWQWAFRYLIVVKNEL